MAFESLPTWRRAALVAGALVLLAVAASRAEDAAAETASPADPELTLARMRNHADAVAAQLRAMNEALGDDSVLAALESDVLQFRQRIADRWTTTDRLIAAAPRRAALEALASAWRSLRIEVVDLEGVVDERAGRREADLRTLDGLRQWWSRSLDTRQADTPDPVVHAEEETLAAVDATRGRVEQRNQRLLALQESLDRSRADCDEALARIEEARRRAVALVFSQRQAPIWSLRDGVGLSDMRARLAAELAVRIDSLTVYLDAYARATAATIGIFVLIAAILIRARRRVVGGTTHGGAESPALSADILQTPFTAALVLTMFFTRPLRPDPPWALAQIIGLVSFPAALRLLRPLLDPRIAAAVPVMIVLLVIEVGRGLLMSIPLLDQIAVMVEMAAAAALFLWIGTRMPAPTAAAGMRSPRLRAAVRALFRVVGVTSAAAAVAAALGYVALADLVGGGGFDLVFAAILLLGVRVAAAGALDLLLVLPPLQRLRSVQARRSAVERGIGAALDVAVVVIWVSLALKLFELLDPASAALQRILDARLQLGSLDLPVSSVFSFVATVVIAWLASRAVVFALEADVYPRVDLPRGVPYALSTLIRYGLLLIGLFLALGMLGLDLTRMTILVSAFGLGVGFGLQQIINNFVSGLILLFERPVQVGDSVQLGDLSGQMLRIGIRSSTIRTGDGAEVIVPNSKLIEEKVTNWTLSDRRRRVDLSVRAAHGTDGARLLALLVDVAKREPRVLREPPPEALFTGFFEKDLEFQLRVWTEDPHWMQLRSALAVAVQEALRDALSTAAAAKTDDA